MYKLNKVLFCLHCFLFISLNPFESVGIFMSHRNMWYVFWDLYVPQVHSLIPLQSFFAVFLIRLKINDPINRGASTEACMGCFKRHVSTSAGCTAHICVSVTNGTPQYKFTLNTYHDVGCNVVWRCFKRHFCQIPVMHVIVFYHGHNTIPRSNTKHSPCAPFTETATCLMKHVLKHYVTTYINKYRILNSSLTLFYTI